MFIRAVPGLAMFCAEEPNFCIIALRLVFVGIIEPNLLCQNHVIQELYCAVALYWAHPHLGSFLIIWNLCDLTELSVLYFSPGGITQLEKFKYHPDRELKDLALDLPGLMLQDLAPCSVKRYYNAFVRWQMWSKSKSISALPADAVGFCLYLTLQTRLYGFISAIGSVVYGVVWAHHKMCLTFPTSHPLTKQVIKAGRRILGKSTINIKLPLKQEHVRAWCSNMEIQICLTCK